MGKKKKKIKIYYDYREKKPWTSSYIGDEFVFEKTKLVTGDYQIKGMEKILVIEKKDSWTELMLNVSIKKYRENFIKELRRMKKYPLKFLIIHADISKIQSMKLYGSVQPEILHGWINNIILEYNVNFLAVGARTKSANIIRELFLRLHEYHRNGRLFCGYKELEHGDK